MKTLEELKAENATEEEELNQESATDLSDAFEEAAEDEAEESQILAEEDAEDTDESEVEAWLQESGDDSSGDHFDSDDVAAIRKKWKGRAKEAEDENAALKARIAELEKGAVTPVKQPESKPFPKLEDYDWDEDQYQEAVIAWQDSLMDTKLQQQSQNAQVTQQQQAALDARNRAVDDHYKRAAKVAQDNGIEPEKYRAADLAVRDLFESLSPGQGNDITENVIHALGEGSEKVMYNIGRNPAKQQKIRELSGNAMALMAYLGELKRDLTATKRGTSKAPKPPKQLSPDGAQTSTESSLERAYKKASKSLDIQKCIDIKREARSKGLDPSKW